MSTTKTRGELARLIEHTLLRPEATAEQIDRLADEYVEHGFYGVCVNPVWVPRVYARLAQPSPRIVSVAGFPLGASLAEVKAYEALEAIQQGAREIDMVANIGALVAGDRDTVVRDIAAVVESVKRCDEGLIVKVILETGALTEPQIVLGCRCVAEAQADFVKTSTGFHPNGGATVAHVALLRRHAAPLKIKAAGGIRNTPDALALLAAGADRLGTSASVEILRSFNGG